MKNRVNNSLFNKQLVNASFVESFRKLDPRVMIKNPIMFTVEVVTFVMLLLIVWIAVTGNTSQGSLGYNIVIFFVLLATVLFANFAEAIAEARGKAQADSLRKTREETPAKRIEKDGQSHIVSSSALRKGDVFECVAGDTIPADGEIIEGLASIDESAITGESAPVIREAGGDKSSVTGGTKVLSDRILVKVTVQPGESFLDTIKSANKEGAHVQGCISYTLSPVHNNEYYVKYAKTLEEMGANSICIKDMAGLLTPYTCYDLVKELKNTLSIPVDIHSHYTAGLASMSLLKGIEAGADIVDTAMSPLSGGTSHMATESLVAALQGTDYDTGLDLKQLNVVRAYFAKLREKYIANGQISPKSLGVDANTLLYQVPGGMFSNMLKQLKDAGKEDKLDEVLAEIPRVREDAGYPPLVTPTSQIVGTQAVFNVILGERYKMVTKEFKGLVHGDYGKTPAPISPEFTKKILGDEQPITCRFADTLAPEMDKLKAEAAKWATQEEDVLTYAMFPQVAPKFFEKRNAKKQGVDADHADYTNQSHPV